MRHFPDRNAPRDVGTIRRSTLLAFLVLLLSMHGVGVAAAQTVRTLEPGTRVRLLLAEARWSVVAAVASARPDTLILTRESTRIESTIPLAISTIRRLEISAGRRQLAPYGAVFGFLFGSVVVGGYNSIIQSQCFSDCPDGVSFLVGGLIGGVAGGVGFSFIRAERWVEVALPRRASPGTEGSSRE